MKSENAPKKVDKLGLGGNITIINIAIIILP